MAGFKSDQSSLILSLSFNIYSDHMNDSKLSVREMQATDIPSIIHYWIAAENSFLQSMGVDINKMPSEQEWMSMLSAQLDEPYEKKKSYCMIWLVNDQPCGHSNVNKISFGKD